MIPREAFDTFLIESEQEHRICHLFLKPAKLYHFWTHDEAKKLKDKYEVVIPKKFTIDQTGKKIIKMEARTAVFFLLDIEGIISPPMKGYVFMGFSDGKQPKKS